MKKSISRKLRVAGCFVLSGALLLTSCHAKETTKKTKKTKKTEETTENPDRYTGEQAGIRLHELDEEIFLHDEDEDIITMFYDLENPETYGLKWPDKGIEPWDPDDEEKAHEFDVYVLDTLNLIEFDDLELEDQVLYETMKRDVQLSLDTYGMDYYTSSINSLTGVNVELPIMFATMIFDDQQDVEHYLTMLADVEGYLDSLLKYEQKRAELGRSLPDDILQNVLDSIEVVYKDHDGNYMYTTFEDRVNALDLDDGTKQELIKKNKEILDSSFFPGYEKLYQGMQGILGTAKTSGKICEMDGGKEFYEKYFQSRSGTNLTIAEAKALLEQVMMDDITEMQTIFAGMTANQQAQVDLDNQYTNGSFEKDIEYCVGAIKTDFPDIGDVKYIVYHIPEVMKDNFSPAAYMSTPYDDINKNLLMINDYSDGMGDMLTTVGHEAFPGHLYETVYHMIHMNNFYQKSGSTAYKEGWSTYSEDYIMKLSDYDYDVYRVNYLYMSLILNYVVPAYIDICVHYDGWGKDEIASYYDNIFGRGMGKAIADSFYDMTREIPCYVTPYTFGNIFCCKIINDAVEKYGDSYSMSEIHAAYLDMGCSNFDTLTKYMDQYVEKQH